jgi:chromosome partitioning protein
MIQNLLKEKLMLTKKAINTLAMIITIAHTKGGVGKSTTVWHLAVMLHNLGVDVTVLDLDFQQTCSMANAIRVANGLTSLNVIQLHDEVELQGFFNDWTNGILLVDVGGFDSMLHRTAMLGADVILTPLKPSTTELLGFKAFTHVLEEIGIPPIKVFFNNIHSNATKFGDIKELISNEYTNVSFLDAVIRNRGNYDTALGDGMGVSEIKRENNLAIKSHNEIMKLATELFKMES